MNIAIFFPVSHFDGERCASGGIPKRIADQIIKYHTQRPLIHLEHPGAVEVQLKPAVSFLELALVGLHHLLEKFADLDGLKLQPHGLRVRLARFQDIVDEAGQPRGVGEHGFNKIPRVPGRDLLVFHGLQVELNGGKGRLEFVRNAGNEITLQAVEPGLLVPVNENHINPCEDDQHEERPFEQNHPGELAVEDLRPELFGELLKLQVVLEVPVDPDHHQADPGHLDADENENGVK